MQENSIRILLTSILLMYFTLVYGEPNAHRFDFKKATEIFESTQKDVKEKSLNLEKLTRSVVVLNKLQTDANTCVKESKQKMDDLAALIESARKELGVSTEDGKWLELEKQRKSHSEQAASCKLFSYRVQQALQLYNKQISELATQKTLSRNAHIFSLLSLKDYQLNQFDTHKFLVHLGHDAFNYASIGVGFSILIITILLAKWLRQKLLAAQQNFTKKRSILYFIVKIASQYLTWLMILISINGYLSILYLEKSDAPFLQIITLSCLLYFTLIFLGNLFLFRPLSKQQFFKLRPSIRRKLFMRYVVVLTIGLICFLFPHAIHEQQLEQDFIEAITSLLIIMLSAATCWMVWLVTQFRVLRKAPGYIRVVMRMILIVLTSLVILSEALGFHVFALYLIKGSISTAILLLLLLELTKGIEHLFEYIEDPTYIASRYLHKTLGIPLHRSIPEMILVRTILYALIFCVFIVFFMSAWGSPVTSIESFKRLLFNGFEVSRITIYPVRIWISIIIFCMLFLAVRIISSITAGHYNRWEERDNQIALASIITYIGFTVSLVIALFIAGVNFTGLAIIAGALSVGIGFGLQHIANNFISGIILLIQNPVKSGDRVLISGYEGYIKRIRILSTHITTMSREDVIIPNSDLITNPVTNYMYRDPYWRVTNRVGVAYGSDINQVMALLEKVATTHPDVLSDPINKPRVLFKEFGDSALIFELWSIIRDVNKKYEISSELNIAINAAFRANGIIIAFPQLDIHVQSKKDSLD